MDAIFLKARQITSSDAEALELLGSIAVREGLQLNHLFTTGLTAEGVLARNDKAGHFFAHAMWSDQDFGNLLPLAPTNGFIWEVIGEIRSWFREANGFDLDDLWANRLGRGFARRVYEQRNEPKITVLPSVVIREANAFKRGGPGS